MPEDTERSEEDTLALDSDLTELERLRAFIDEFCARHSLPEQTHYHLSVALEELVINAMKHGACDPPQGAIRLRMWIENGGVRMVLRDTGVAFDPLRAAPPDLTQNVLARPVGGLGVHLVRCLIPEIRYERRDGQNYLYLTKPVQQEGAPAHPEEDTDARRHGDYPG